MQHHISTDTLTNPRIAAMVRAALDAPKTHVVVTLYADGTTKRHETRSLASAETHANMVVRPQLGRDLIDRKTGETVHMIGVYVSTVAAEG
jgi:hypothetical protein